MIQQAAKQLRDAGEELTTDRLLQVIKGGI